jgi:aminomethyltransferase
MKRTALYDAHLKLGAKMTEFYGWELPLYYTSILDEHRAVRQAAGMFDVSHMGQVIVSGSGACAMLNELAVSDVASIGIGRACYTMLLNEQGGILDDIIIFRLAEAEYLVVVNCANRASDVDWLARHRPPNADVRDLSEARGIVAVQGPASAALLDAALETRVSAMGRFDAVPLGAWGPQGWIARTGYTGGDGFELLVSNEQAVRLWQRLLNAGAPNGMVPAGLGARDTLRLEGGLRLCGTDMDASTTPYEADLGWTVAINKTSFIGKDVLVKQRAGGVARRLMGFRLEQGPVPRHDCAITALGRPIGRVTSGTFSPLLNAPIGLAYLEASAASPGTAIAAVIRDKSYPGAVVKLPFWKPEGRGPSTRSQDAHSAGAALHQNPRVGQASGR